MRRENPLIFWIDGKCVEKFNIFTDHPDMPALHNSYCVDTRFDVTDSGRYGMFSPREGDDTSQWIHCSYSVLPNEFKLALTVLEIY